MLIPTAEPNERGVHQHRNLNSTKRSMSLVPLLPPFLPLPELRQPPSSISTTSSLSPNTNKQVAPAVLSPSTVEYHRIFDSFIHGSPIRQQLHLLENIYENQNGSSSQPARYATVPSAEGNGSTDNGKTKKVRDSICSSCYIHTHIGTITQQNWSNSLLP